MGAPPPHLQTHLLRWHISVLRRLNRASLEITGGEGGVDWAGVVSSLTQWCSQEGSSAPANDKANPVRAAINAGSPFFFARAIICRFADARDTTVAETHARSA